MQYGRRPKVVNALTDETCFYGGAATDQRHAIPTAGRWPVPTLVGKGLELTTVPLRCAVFFANFCLTNWLLLLSLMQTATVM